MTHDRRASIRSERPDERMQPEIRHYCGLFAIAGHPDAARLTYYGLFALQHRGQEAAGICTSNGRELELRTGLGLVSQAFTDADLQALTNPIAIGHTRYSTTGSCSEMNAQPFVRRGSRGGIGIAHNGNLVNAASLRRECEHRGTLFTTSSDTEVILHMLADPRYADLPDPEAGVLRQLRGSYCLLLIHPDRIEAVRDPSGNRPLCLGQLDGAWIACSETCALDAVRARYVREVEPGEIVTLSGGQGLTSRRFVPPEACRPALCIFEQIYFADPASQVFGQNVHEARRAMGRQLALEAPAAADLIVEVPNSGRCAALGYHEQSGIPLGRGFTTNHYAGRSFIRPSQQDRDLTVRLKLNVIRSQVEGKRLVVIEDSVVRGTTTRGKMEALRAAGAREIHLRVASPPIRHPCYYGIDFPSRRELIAHERTIDQVRAELGVDSLAYLSVEGMLRCVRHAPAHYCTACFTGQYPMPIEEPMEKGMFEKNQLKLFEPPAGAAESDGVAVAAEFATPQPGDSSRTG